MTPMPKPATRVVFLPSEGCNRATRHRYVRTVLEPDKELGHLAFEWRFIFRCDETGTERVYGVQDARPGFEVVL